LTWITSSPAAGAIALRRGNAIAICKLVEDRYVNSILMSQDVFLKMMLVRFGGFGYVRRHFAPRLKRHGMGQATIDHILIENRRRVFSAH
jgi:phosphotriesterase-related protein